MSSNLQPVERFENGRFLEKRRYDGYFNSVMNITGTK